MNRNWYNQKANPALNTKAYNYLAGSLINATTYKCADSREGYGAFLRLFVCCCCFFVVVVFALFCFFVYWFDS